MGAPWTDGVEELTLEEYWNLPDEESYRDELVRGRLVLEPIGGAEHGWLAANLFREIQLFSGERGLGQVFFSVGFILSEAPPTVRGPDLSFMTEERLAVEGLPERYWHGAPDLAVEIVSPSDKATDMQERILDYLDSGVRLVWVIHPQTRTVTVYRSPSDIRLVRKGEVLEGADVLPGFVCPLLDLFAPYRPTPRAEKEDEQA